MYNVPHFKTDDQQDVIAFMQAHPFIVLCGVTADGKPVATHVPVLMEARNDRLFLLGHVMRKQEHTKAFEANAGVLAIFHSAHTYVSASWYENKRVASTWNYLAVHAQGKLRFTGQDELQNVLTKLTEKFENNPASPSLVQNMDAAYLQNMMKAIVAFEIEITALDHVFKLSQNRDEKSYENIVTVLENSGADGNYIADEMRKRKNRIFAK